MSASLSWKKNHAPVRYLERAGQPLHGGRRPVLIPDQVELDVVRLAFDGV